MTQGRYKTLISGTLVQQSAFSTGGNNPNNLVDSPLSLDGLGRPIIRGTSLAGALIAQAKQLGEIGEQISQGLPNAQKSKDASTDLRLRESVWRFHHAHLSNNQSLDHEYRSGVAISNATGAAKEGAKFSVETLPAGTRWDLLLEIDEYLDDSENALATALLSLEEWCLGHCWLGRDVARGLGWMKLENMQVYRLSPEHAAIWPNSTKDTHTIIQQDLAHTLLTDFDSLYKHLLPQRKTQQLIGTGRITINPRVDDEETPWGLEMLAVGAEDSAWSPQSLSDEQLIMPEVFDPTTRDSLIDEKITHQDNLLAWTNVATTQEGELLEGPQPYIPGSSIRGVLRHALEDFSKLASEPSGASNILTQLFGSMEHSAELLISDAYLSKPDYQAVILEMHAEDEFTGSTFATSKFDRTALVQGSFEFKLALQTSHPTALQHYRRLFQQLNQLGNQHFLPIGASQWRGIGWVHWQFELEQDNNLTGGDHD